MVAAKVAKTAATPGAKSALTRVVSVSPVLKKFLGVGELPRSEIGKRIWAYVKENKLQNPKNGREIVCDEKLKTVFGQDLVTFSEVQRLLAPHIPKAKKED